MPVLKPNNSTPIMAHARGVFVAAANTATKPMAVKKPSGNGKNANKALPKAAPTKNKGVTSPPLNPELKVKVVSNNFTKKT